MAIDVYTFFPSLYRFMQSLVNCVIIISPHFSIGFRLSNRFSHFCDTKIVFSRPFCSPLQLFLAYFSLIKAQSIVPKSHSSTFLARHQGDRSCPLFSYCLLLKPDRALMFPTSLSPSRKYVQIFVLTCFAQPLSRVVQIIDRSRAPCCLI
jgi:hypothetical protein